MSLSWANTHKESPLFCVGGLFIMTGDVLPCFAASGLYIPDNGVCVVTVPASLDLAAKHGVIVSQIDIPSNDTEKIKSVFKVEDLLQKPSKSELVSKGAIGTCGNVFVDTGMFGLKGDAWGSLIEFSVLQPDPVSQLLASDQEVFLLFLDDVSFRLLAVFPELFHNLDVAMAVKFV